MSKNISPESALRLQAVNRLNASTRQVYDRCMARDNAVDISMLRSVYEFSADLVLVRSNIDTYGQSGLEDLAAALALSDRQTSKYLAISKVISSDEMKSYEIGVAADGRVFTATHLMILCGLSSTADRRKAFKQWQVNSMKAIELEEYIQELNRDSKNADDEDGDAAPAAPPTTVRTLQRLATLADKALAAVSDLEAVDLGTYVMTLQGKSVEVLTTYHRAGEPFDSGPSVVAADQPASAA